MEDALAIVGQWIGLVKSARLSISEVLRDCEERVTEGHVVTAEDFQDAVATAVEKLSMLQVKLEEQEELLEGEMEDSD